MIYLLTLLINDAWRACQFRRVEAAGARSGLPGTHFNFQDAVVGVSLGEGIMSRCLRSAFGN
jgi:hypothetical protein